MASRSTFQFQATLEPGLVTLYAVVDFTAPTAPVLQRWNAAAQTYTPAGTSGYGGIKSLTYVSTGLYEFFLGSGSSLNPTDSYRRLLSVSATQQLSGGVPTVLAVGVDTAVTNVTSNTAPVIQAALVSATGTKANPASGLVVFSFTLQNSSAQG